MATLADTFLADFGSDEEGLSNDEEEQQNENEATGQTSTIALGDASSFANMSDEDDDDDAITSKSKSNDGSAAFSVDENSANGKTTVDESKSIAGQLSKLHNSVELKNHLTEIAELLESSLNPDTGLHQDVDAEDEQDVIVESNQYAQQIDDDIVTIYGYVKELYAAKYSELERIVVNPLEYVKVVKIIGNKSDLSSLEGELATIVPQTLILSITVTAMTTAGRPLSEEKLRCVMEACDAVLDLEATKQTINAYIETRMVFIAPNITALVGSKVTALLLGITGGLKELAGIPACNVQVIGQKKQIVGGLSTAKNVHVGVIGGCDLVYRTPSRLQMKAIGLVANKFVLAARADLFKQDRSGNYGATLHQTVQDKINKWQEPPPQKLARALPVPLGPQKKRRGGRRARLTKQRYEITEVAKLKKRAAFGKAEIIDDYTGEEFGMLGQDDAGRLRVKPKNTQKLTQAATRGPVKRVKKLSDGNKTTSGSVTGSASTIAFTPVQGMELVGVDKGNQEIQHKYFSDHGSFIAVKKRKIAQPVPKFTE